MAAPKSADSVNLLKSAWKRAGRDFFSVWGRAWKIAVPLTIVFELAELFFGSLQEQNGPDGQPLALLGLILLSLAWPLTWVLIIPKYAMDVRGQSAPMSLLAHFKKHFSQVCIESLRVMGKVSIQLLLLIVPGIIKILRLYFVPLIVQFNPAYERGEVAALEESERLVTGRTWQLAGFLTTCVVVSWTPMLAKYFVSPFEYPLVYSVIVLTGLCGEIMADIAIVDYFVHLTSLEVKHGTSI